MLHQGMLLIKKCHRTRTKIDALKCTYGAAPPLPTEYQCFVYVNNVSLCVPWFLIYSRNVTKRVRFCGPFSYKKRNGSGSGKDSHIHHTFNRPCDCSAKATHPKCNNSWFPCVVLYWRLTLSYLVQSPEQKENQSIIFLRHLCWAKWSGIIQTHRYLYVASINGELLSASASLTDPLQEHFPCLLARCIRICLALRRSTSIVTWYMQKLENHLW